MARGGGSIDVWIGAALAAACGGQVHDTTATAVEFDGGSATRCDLLNDPSDVDDAYFYEDLVDFGTLYAVRSAGDVVVPLWRGEDAASLVLPLVFDASHVYFVKTAGFGPGESITAWAPAGRSGRQKLIGGLTWVFDLTVDGQSLYFIDYLGPKTTLGAVALSDACPEQYRKIVEVENTPITTVASHSGYLYWTELSGGFTGAPNGTVKRMPTGGGASPGGRRRAGRADDEPPWRHVVLGSERLRVRGHVRC